MSPNFFGAVAKLFFMAVAKLFEGKTIIFNNPCFMGLCSEENFSSLELVLAEQVHHARGKLVLLWEVPLGLVGGWTVYPLFPNPGYPCIQLTIGPIRLALSTNSINDKTHSISDRV